MPVESDLGARGESEPERRSSTLLEKLPPLRFTLPVLFVIGAIICGTVALALTLSAGKRLIESEYRNHASFLSRLVATRMEHELRVGDTTSLNRSLRLLNLDRNMVFGVLIDPSDQVFGSSGASRFELSKENLALASEARADRHGIAHSLRGGDLLVTAVELGHTGVYDESRDRDFVLVLGHDLRRVHYANRENLLIVAGLSIIPIGLATALFSLVLRKMLVGRMRQLLAQLRETERLGRPSGRLLHGADEFAFLSKQIDSMAADLSETNRALVESEDRLSHALRGSNDGLWDWDLLTDQVYFSPRWRTMLGYEEDEWENSLDTWKELLHPDDQEKAIRYVERFLRENEEGRPFRLEFRLRGKGGRYHDILSRAFLIQRDGEPVRMVGTHVDISELKRTRKNLRLARFSLETAPLEVFWIDKKGRVIFGNETARSDLEYTEEELRTLRVSDFDAKGLAGDWETFFERVKAQGTIAFEAEHRTSSGRIYPVDIRAGYCRYEGLEYLCVFCWDATERKQTERNIRSLNENLEGMVERRTRELNEANKALESFAYTVSHDLRAPVRAASCFAEALEADYIDQLPVEAAEYVSRILDSTTTMSRMINAVLELSRIGRGTITRQDVSLDRLAEDIVEQFQRSDPERDVSVSIQSGITASGDEDLVRILLQNILGNSWKFTEGVSNPTVRFSMIEVDGESVFQVEDNGVGFDMESMTDLFEPFNRYHGKSEFPGEGIGLATVKRIVGRHGGWVELQSKVGKGTGVRFTLARKNG